MKILQAFDFLSLPHGGGTVDIVYKLSKALAKQGHEVTICTGDHEIDHEYISNLGDVGLKMYHSYFNRHGIYLMPGLSRIDVSGYDLIHLHCYRSFQNVVLAGKAISCGVPYIVDAHGSTVPRSGAKTLLLNAYDSLIGRKLVDHAKFVIAETDTGASEWERLGVNTEQPNKLRLRHPLLDTSEFDVLPEKRSRNWCWCSERLHSPTILFLGRIHQSKGLDTLLYALRQVIDTYDSKAKLVIAGQDDGYEGALIELMEELGLRGTNSVFFTGYLSGVNKLAALVDADVLVQPSRNEAGARPSLESIMCGTPVVVSRDTGAGSEIDKFNGGLLFKSGDAGELAEAIQDVIDHPDEAKARTEKAKVYIEKNLSLDNGIVEYERLYQEAIK